MYSNGKKIFRTGRQTGQFSFFHGMKVLSMCWVILFHRFVFLPIITINAADFQEVRETIICSCIQLYYKQCFSGLRDGMRLVTGVHIWQ